jgi:hypothetical protein
LIGEAKADLHSGMRPNIPALTSLRFFAALSASLSRQSPAGEVKPARTVVLPAALGAYREWLQDSYIEGGKFSNYLQTKVSKGELAPSIAQLAIAALKPLQIAAH